MFRPVTWGWWPPQGISAPCFGFPLWLDGWCLLFALSGRWAQSINHLPQRQTWGRQANTDMRFKQRVSIVKSVESFNVHGLCWEVYEWRKYELWLLVRNVYCVWLRLCWSNLNNTILPSWLLDPQAPLTSHMRSLSVVLTVERLNTGEGSPAGFIISRGWPNSPVLCHRHDNGTFVLWWTLLEVISHKLISLSDPVFILQ